MGKGAGLSPAAIAQAREGMLGCLVTIHGETLKRGAQLLGKALDDEQTEKHATAITKGSLGSHWEQPTSKSLHDARIKMDQKMHFSKAPEDLQELHSRVCNRIVSKI